MLLYSWVKVDTKPYFVASTVSCQSTNVDSCCSPKNGLVVLALQWIVGYGPSDEFTVHGKFNFKLGG